jgi:hypothetical protein
VFNFYIFQSKFKNRLIVLISQYAPKLTLPYVGLLKKILLFEVFMTKVYVLKTHI